MGGGFSGQRKVLLPRSHLNTTLIAMRSKHRFCFLLLLYRLLSYYDQLTTEMILKKNGKLHRQLLKLPGSSMQRNLLAFNVFRRHEGYPLCDTTSPTFFDQNFTCYASAMLCKTLQSLNFSFWQAINIEKIKFLSTCILYFTCQVI